MYIFSHRISLVTFFCALILAAPMAKATTVNDIQMLPPIAEGNPGSPCPAGGGSRVLAWDGVSPIDCATGIKASSGNLSASTITAAGNVSANTMTASGNITANNMTASGNITSGNISTGSVSASGSVTASGSVNGAQFDIPNASPITGTDANTLANLAGLQGCGQNQALTANGNGTFSCVQISDITNVGKTTVPNCTNGSFLTFSGGSFGCSAPQAAQAVNISCPAGQILTGISNGQPVCQVYACFNGAPHDWTPDGSLAQGGTTYSQSAPVGGYISGIHDQSCTYINGSGEITAVGSANYWVFQCNADGSWSHTSTYVNRSQCLCYSPDNCVSF